VVLAEEAEGVAEAVLEQLVRELTVGEDPGPLQGAASS
jgi:hypothetical protein